MSLGSLGARLWLVLKTAVHTRIAWLLDATRQGGVNPCQKFDPADLKIPLSEPAQRAGLRRVDLGGLAWPWVKGF